VCARGSNRALLRGPSTSPLDGMKTVVSIGVLSFALGASALSAVDATSAFTLPSGVAIQIVEAPFDPAKHHIQGCGSDSVSHPSSAAGCLIDGRLVFGSAVEMPRTYVRSITAAFAGRRYSLDVSQMYNAWGTRPLEIKGAVRYFGGRCEDALNCTLRGLFSDAGGAYVAEWQIVNGVSQRTILTWSDDVVVDFMKHIDPPKYD
jgi:hypothetical protein